MSERDPKSVFFHAVCFEYASMLLWQAVAQRLETSLPGSTFTMPTLVPAIANSAFSIELYLWCLSTMDSGEAPRGNGLFELFQGLTPEHRRRAKEIYNEECEKNELFVSHEVQGTNHRKVELDNALREIDDALRQWRCCYEGVPSYSEYSGAPVQAALRRVILEAQPDWEDLKSSLGPVPTFQAC